MLCFANGNTLTILRHLRASAPDLQSPPEQPKICGSAAADRRVQSFKKGGEFLVRSGILALMLVLAACSSDSAPVPPSDPQASAALLKKDCSDPKWREENLGLWYSVCRPPLRW